ncbi:MAG: Y-family DNA polymerase [Armatimonadetes bacterium]|nr:MAG: Y-family DNA polymerase [Armatimonadota bacterium]
MYGDMSSRVMEVLGRFASEIEVYSIDEAFLNLEGFERRDLTAYAREIRATVRKWTGIPVSVGIGPTKTLAKVANHVAKKLPVAGGVWNLSGEFESELDALLEATPVEEVWGIGPVYRDLLRRHGITTAKALRDADDRWVQKHMTVVGLKTVWELRGISCLPLELCPPPKKGICVSRSFGRPVETLREMHEAISTYAARAAEKLREERLLAGQMVVFLRTNPFKEEPQYANSVSVKLPVPTSLTPELLSYASEVTDRIWRQGFRYKKAGVFLTEMSQASCIQPAFFDEIHRERAGRLMRTVDRINERLGSDVIRYGSMGFSERWAVKAGRRSPAYTTRWEDLPATCAR